MRKPLTVAELQKAKRRLGFSLYVLDAIFCANLLLAVILYSNRFLAYYESAAQAPPWAIVSFAALSAATFLLLTSFWILHRKVVRALEGKA